MNRRFLRATAVILILASTLVLRFNVPLAEAGATVYIHADGSIDPPSANITSADNATYTLIGNVNDSVVVQRANIVLDGAGYTVQGAGSGIGINVTGVSNVTIKNCIIKSYRVGIYLDVGSNGGIVTNNTIQGMSGAPGEDAVGIYLKSNYNMIYDNSITSLFGGTGGIGSPGGVSSGIYLSSSTSNNVTSNTITNSTGGTGGGGAPGGSGGVSSGVYLSSSTSNNIASNTITNLTGGTGGGGSSGWVGGSGGVSSGVYLSSSTSNNIASNTITNLTGGTGGTGSSYTSGGSGGVSSGVCLSSSTNNSLTSNVMANLAGGTGGTMAPGSVGAGGVSAGIWLDTSSYNNKVTALTAQGSYKVPDISRVNTIEGKPILYFYGEDSVKISGFNVTTKTAPILIGGSTATGGWPEMRGGSGGLSTGLALVNTTNSIVQNNIISGFKGMNGGTGNSGGAGGSGGVSSGVYLSGSASNNITSNTIASLTGGAGGTGSYGGIGGSGGVSSGVYLSSSTSNNITSNTLTNLTGGTGGTGGGSGSGGSGGVSSGIYLSSSTSNNVTSNTITNSTGGTGGKGYSDSGGSGGSGGVSSGVYLSGSASNNITSNTIASLTGGTGGTGINGGSDGVSAGIWLDTSSYNNKVTALMAQGSYKVPDISRVNTIEGKPILYFYGEDSVKISGFNVTTKTAPILIGGSTATGSPGGTGGLSAGIVLISTTNSIVENNTISGFKGMNGGTGNPGGAGGSGGVSSGVYLSGSASNNITSNTIASLTGGTGGTGGWSYGGYGGSGGVSSGVYLSSSTSNNITSNTIASLTGGTGGTGGMAVSGGSGGVSSGVYLSSSTSNNITSNTIASLTGGTGGTGGFSGGKGGSGGVSSGVYLSSSTSNNITSNTIANLTGGTRGAAGAYGSPGVKGTSYSLYLDQSNSMTIQENTLETADYCFYLYSSNSSSIYHNNINATTNQVYNNASNNNWDKGYPYGGNFWSNYTGVDNYSGRYQNETGSDGIGDTPFQIDQYNKDNYPIMTKGPWTHDVAIINITLSTSDAYTGQVIEVNITAKNSGNRYENFNVTASYDDTVIGNQEVNLLAPGTQETLCFSWNTTDVAGGYYVISARASIVPEEVNTTNNVFIDGVARITSPVRITEVIPCNQTGYFKDTFQRGTIAYFKVTINSTALIPQNTLITINLYDNSSITIGVVSIQGPTWPGISTIIFGLSIPATATIGTATVYANCYTDWPSQGGFPHCPEMPATLEITGP